MPHQRSGTRSVNSSVSRIGTPMPGTVVALPIALGSRVERDDVIAIVEAMKMENRIHAQAAGTLTALHCQLGDIVAAGQTLASITPDAA